LARRSHRQQRSRWRNVLSTQRRFLKELLATYNAAAHRLRSSHIVIKPPAYDGEIEAGNGPHNSRALDNGSTLFNPDHRFATHRPVQMSQLLAIVSWFAVFSGLFTAVAIALDILMRPQHMKIMNIDSMAKLLVLRRRRSFLM
jgi:hypothetical protein